MVVKLRTDWLSQERIVFLLAAILFLVASISLKGFFAPDNLVAIVRSVSVLGILALGMAIVIIGRGIDLSAVAIMAMSVAWYLQLLNDGTAGRAGACAYVLAGVLADRPAQRLPRRLCRCAGDLRDAGERLLRLRLCALAADHAGCRAGAARPLGRDCSAACASSTFRSRCSSSPALAFLLFLFLRYTKWGRYVYLRRRQSGGGAQYRHPGAADAGAALCDLGAVAFVAGLLTAASLHSINTRVVNSTLLYDIVLVAVIGGIGLSGGKGGVRNVLVGAALIGIMLNAMTIIDIPLLYQNLIKATILLGAIIVDGISIRATNRPRSRATSRQPAVKRPDGNMKQRM